MEGRFHNSLPEFKPLGWTNSAAQLSGVYNEDNANRVGVQRESNRRSAVPVPPENSIRT